MTNTTEGSPQENQSRCKGQSPATTDREFSNEKHCVSINTCRVQVMSLFLYVVKVTRQLGRFRMH